jgi:hypothetical protein
VLGQPDELVAVQIRHQRVAELAVPPEHDREAAHVTDRCGHAAEVALGLREREAVGAEDKQRLRVQAAPVDEHLRRRGC